ncbi:MAG: S41 family peptidase [Gemmatimonadota bacterium]
MTVSRRLSRYAIAVAITATIAGSSTARAQRTAYEELQTFSGVLNHVRINYVDSVGSSRMIRAAIAGILSDLDPHSHFLSRESNDALLGLQRGDLGSPGIFLEEVGGELVVRTLVRGGPADRGGVFPGDRVVAIDSVPVAGLGSQEAEAHLAGKKGSKVRLQIERGPRFGLQTIDVTLKREERSPRSTSVMRRIGTEAVYVRLDQFGDRAAKELKRALKDGTKNGPNRVILDLRGNPGGLVREAVSMAAEFLPKGSPVFSTRGRKRDVDVDYVSDRNGSFRNIQLAILIDEGSASAAEALAGALQDLDRAVIIGRRSFGKALMQSPFLLPGGDIVWLTIGRVYTPAGRLIQRSYSDVNAAQYRALAGSENAPDDTLPTLSTKNGRAVRGGGGIVPDIVTPRPPDPPLWWSEAVADGLVAEVADSVSAYLSGGAMSEEEWVIATGAWREMVEPLLARVRDAFGAEIATTEPALSWLSRELGRRVAAARWGLEAQDHFEVATDPDIKAAIESSSTWPQILRPPAASPAVPAE